MSEDHKKAMYDWADIAQKLESENATLKAEIQTIKGMAVCTLQDLQRENAELKAKLEKFDRLKLYSFMGYTEDELRTMIQHYKETGYNGLIHENAALKARIAELEAWKTAAVDTANCLHDEVERRDELLRKIYALREHGDNPNAAHVISIKLAQLFFDPLWSEILAKEEGKP